MENDGFYKRKIVRDPNNSSGYMVLKPLIDNPQQFNKNGCCYTPRGLYNYLKNVRKSISKGETPSVEIIIGSSISGNGDITTKSIDLEFMLSILKPN